MKFFNLKFFINYFKKRKEEFYIKYIKVEEKDLPAGEVYFRNVRAGVINKYLSIDFVITYCKYFYFASFYFFFYFSKIINFFGHYGYIDIHFDKYPYYKNKLFLAYWPFKSTYWYFFNPSDIQGFRYKIYKKTFPDPLFPKGSVLYYSTSWGKTKRRVAYKKNVMDYNTFELSTIYVIRWYDMLKPPSEERSSEVLNYISTFGAWEREYNTHYEIFFKKKSDWKFFSQSTDVKNFSFYEKFFKFKIFNPKMKNFSKFIFSDEFSMSAFLGKINLKKIYIKYKEKQKYEKKDKEKKKFKLTKFGYGLDLFKRYVELVATNPQAGVLHFNRKKKKIKKIIIETGFKIKHLLEIFNSIERKYAKKKYKIFLFDENFNYFFQIKFFYFPKFMLFLSALFTFFWQIFRLIIYILATLHFIFCLIVVDYMIFFVCFFIPTRFIYRLSVLLSIIVFGYFGYLLYKINLKPIIDLHGVEDFFARNRYWFEERPKIKIIKSQLPYVFAFASYVLFLFTSTLPHFYSFIYGYEFFLKDSSVAPEWKPIENLKYYYSRFFKGFNFINFRVENNSVAFFITYLAMAFWKSSNFFSYIFISIIKNILTLRFLFYRNLIIFFDNFIENYWPSFTRCYYYYYYCFIDGIFLLKKSFYKVNFFSFYKMIFFCLFAFFTYILINKTYFYFSSSIFKLNCAFFFFFVIYWWFFIIAFTKEFFEFKFSFMTTSKRIKNRHANYDLRLDWFILCERQRIAVDKQMELEEKEVEEFDNKEQKAKIRVILEEEWYDSYNGKKPYYKYHNISEFGFEWFKFILAKAKVKFHFDSVFKNKVILDRSTNKLLQCDDEDEEYSVFFNGPHDFKKFVFSPTRIILNTFFIDLVIVIWLLIFFCKTLDPFHFFYFPEYFHRHSISRFYVSKLREQHEKDRRKYFFNVPFKYQKVSWKKRKTLLLGFKDIFFYFPIDQYYAGNRTLSPTSTSYYFQKYYYSFVKNFFNLYYSNIPITFDFLSYYSEFNIFKHRFFSQNWFAKEKFITDFTDNEFSTRKSKYNIFEETRLSKKKWDKTFKRWVRKFHRTHNDDYYKYYRKYVNKKYLKKSVFYPFYDRKVIKTRHFFYQKLNNVVYDSRKDFFYNFLYNYAQTYFTGNKFYEKVIIPSFKKYFLINDWHYSENMSFYKKTKKIKNRLRIGAFSFNFFSFFSQNVKNKILFWKNFLSYGMTNSYNDKASHRKSLVYFFTRVSHKGYIDTRKKGPFIWAAFSEFELSYLRKKAAVKNVVVKHPYYLFGEYKPYFAKPKNKYFFPNRNYNLDYYFLNMRKIKYYNSFSYKYFRFSVLHSYLSREKKKKGFLFDLLGSTKKNFTYNYIYEQYKNQMESYHSYVNPIPKKRQFRIPLKTKFIERFIELNQNKYKKFHLNSRKFVTYGDKIKKNYV